MKNEPLAHAARSPAVWKALGRELRHMLLSTAAVLFLIVLIRVCLGRPISILVHLLLPALLCFALWSWALVRTVRRALASFRRSPSVRPGPP